MKAAISGLMAVAAALLTGCSSPAAGNVPAVDSPTQPWGAPAAGATGITPYPEPAAPTAPGGTPTHVIGTGTPESVTSAAFVAAVAQGGVITFNGGSKPFILTLDETAKVVNTSNYVTIDGGGLVVLSGGNARRILYMNTADPAQIWTTSHAQNQQYPVLTVQNLTFIDGYAPEADGCPVCGGGAIYDYGGQLSVLRCRFFHNGCITSGPDVAGGAIRAFAQYNNTPILVADCTFGGPGALGNYGSNGGAVGSIGASWMIYNSLFQGNTALGNGGNPANAGTPGGGSGGAIYNDGNSLYLSVYGCLVEDSRVNAFGSAIFFVDDDLTGAVHLVSSVFKNNTGGSWYTQPGISMKVPGQLTVTNTTFQ